MNSAAAPVEDNTSQTGMPGVPAGTPAPDPEPEVIELTPEQRFEQACAIVSPIKKHNGKTLGEILTMEPRAINWLATKFSGDETIKAAAEFICSYSMAQATA